MAANEYRFETHWRVEATPAEVFALIDKPTEFVRWWPSVWLKVETLEPGQAGSVDRVVRFTSKGWLPHTLRWTARTVESTPPHRLAIVASGDFEGAGEWTLRADGSFADVEYVWTIEAHKPLLRVLSPVLRPLFAANHQWAMARGEESLRLELARRRAATDEERGRIPPPPAATFVRRGP